MPHPETIHLREILVFLFAAGVVVPVVQRFKISPVLGFLGIGVLIGPDGLGLLARAWPQLSSMLTLSDAGVRFLGELGVIFLLFTIGLELSLSRLMSMRKLVFGLGSLQVLVTAGTIAGIAYLFGNKVDAAIVIGGALALSSTAIVMQLLTERGRLGSTVGRASFAVLLLQDMAVVPILLLVSLLSGEARGSVILEVIRALAAATLAISAILVAGRLLIRPFFRFVGATRSPEAFMAAALLTIIGTAAATSTAGLSLALGAFLAGLVFSDTEYRHEIEVNVAPFKGLLLGVFFMSIGMGLNIRGLLAEPFWILASVAGLLVLKAVIMLPLARWFGLSWGQSLESAMLLSQSGEFAFVVIGAAMTLKLISPQVGQFILIVAGLTMIAAPGIARLAERLGSRFEQRATAGGEPQPTESLEGHVVIAGYGRVGRLLASILDVQHVPHVAIDQDAQTVAAERKSGHPVYYGNAARTEMLKRVSADKALALVVTLADPAAAERIVRSARATCPRVPVLVRARDMAHADRLYALGANAVVPETTEASLQLGEALLRDIGLPDEAARHLVNERRELERLAHEAVRLARLK